MGNIRKADTRTCKQTRKSWIVKVVCCYLSQWIKGTGLSFIIKEALEFKRQNPETCVWDNWKPVRYDDSLRHRNLVISDTLQVIENVILFSISNYFFRFSSEYMRFHNVESFPNDWYEYVEYGTTNPLSITLQRNGFSRETSRILKGIEINTLLQQKLVKLSFADLLLIVAT